MIIKYAKLKCINPLLIVKSLKGTGEKPAIASKVIQAIIPPSEDAEEIPTPTPTATGGYTCPDGWLYDANTSSCVKQGKGFGGQGMNMGGAVSPSLNNAVDNFIQALA